MKKKILEIIKEEVDGEIYIPIKGEHPPKDTHIPTWAALIKTTPSFTKDGELKSGVVPRKLKQNYALILEGDPMYSDPQLGLCFPVTISTADNRFCSEMVSMYLFSISRAISS